MGGLAAVVASSLVFSGMSPAVAEEVTDPTTTTEQATTQATDAATPPAAEEPAAPPAAVEPAPVEPAPAAPEATTPEATTPDEVEAAPFAALAAPNAEEDVVALACTPLFYGFEIDGDRPANCGGNDWDSVPDASTNGHGPYKTDNDISDPATWYAAGNPAQHSTILNGQAWSTLVNGDPILFAAWDRESGTGSSGFIIEITKAPTRTGGIGNVPQPDRSQGGTVFYLDQSGNNGTILRGACTYTSLANYPGTCVTSNFPAGSFAGVTSEDGTFVEVGLNLALLANVKPGCPPTLGSAVYIRSFTGNNNELGGNIQAWAGPLTITPPSTCGSLAITKKNEAGAGLQGATFRISPSPTTNDPYLDVTTGVGGTITLSGTVKPGAYTVTEIDAPPGYLLPTPASQPVNVVTGQTASLVFIDPLGAVSWEKRSAAAGNPLLGGATFRITATGGDAANAPWDLDSNPITVTDNAGRDTNPAAGQLTVTGLPTGTYSVVETAAPSGYVLDATPRTFEIKDGAASATIENDFINIPYATVTLTKNWVNAFDGDKADISIGGDGQAAATSTAPVNGPVIQVQVAPGSELDLLEVLNGQNRGSYTSSLSCGALPISDNQGTSGSITVPQWPASATPVACTFTNTAKTTTVTLQKKWVDAFQGDSAKLSLTGDADGATSVATGAAGSQLDDTNVATATVRVGETVNFGEQLTTPSGASYGTTFSCTPTQTLTGGDKAYTLERMPDANVVCTFTNAAQKATVTLKKQWVNAFEDDIAHLSITGAGTASAAAEAPEGNGTSPQTAQVSVRIGDKVSLSEELDGDNQGDYTSTWSCTNGQSGNGENIGQLTVTGSVECTIVNTAKTIEVKVHKTWVDAFGGDTAQISLNGETKPSTAGTLGQLIVNETDSDVVVQTVRVGDDVNIAESLTGNRGTYSSSYVCTGYATQGSTTTIPGFEAPGVNVECTFTNTSVKVGVLLQKRWVGGLLNDESLLSVSPEFGPLLTKLSKITGGVTTFTDETNVIELQARIGAVLPMAESVTGNGEYDSSYSCLGGGQTSGQGAGRAFALTVTAATSPDGKIRCLFVNTARTATVHLVKTWVNGQTGDSADLSISGLVATTGTSVSNGAVGSFTDTENAISKQALIGSQVTVGELIKVVKGAASDYTSTLVCTTGDETEIFAADGRQGAFPMPNESVWCEFTNTAEQPTLALAKVVTGAPGVSDTNWVLTAAPELGPVLTNLNGGDVPRVAVPAGMPFHLSEALKAAFPGSNEFAAGQWACFNEAETPIAVTNSVAGAADLAGLNKGEDVTCVIVNSHLDQGFDFDKSAVSSVQRPDGTWDVTYKITVHNNSVLVPVMYDLSDTLDEPADGVTYLDAAWTGPTSGSFDLETSLTADLATGEELAPYDAVAQNDAIYTVVVHVAVDAVPAESEACPDEEDGIGIVNSATITVGEESDTDDACGTVHFDDVDIEKTASDLPEGGSVEPGDTFDYVLTVTNNGTRTAEDVVVTDEVPERLEVVDVTLPDGWTNDNGTDLVDGDNVLSVSVPTLAVGASAEIVLTVQLTATPVAPVEPGDSAEQPPAPLEELTNTACVAAERDQVEENNCDTVDIPVREITAIVYTRCVGDAPLLGWTITKSQALLGEEINFLWTPDSGTATTDPAEVAITQPGGTATWNDEIDWPGAAFTPSGVSIDYPGWRPIVASDIVPGSSPTQYYYPGTTEIISAEDQPDYVFNGLILDDSELDYAWRLGSTVTFQVNPELVFAVEYPAATPECFVARHSDVQIEKTASVDKTQPGASFTYSLAVANVSDDSAAENVVVTDTIPADIKITDVTWTGKGDANVFPNWQSCEVTGQNASGYGGALECVLFGPLQPQGANEGASAAPTITLSATVNPASKASSITNVAVVDYHTFGNPDDPGRDSDDATVLLSALPVTGGSIPPVLVILGLLALLAGTTMIVVTRRRRGEARGTV
ncbi:SpaA isopeptide-forming pilin-related protein [Microbacterium arthrosphaerae]|uniref:SpaA isopeptide-forming pilin-related protein n=1 Tax=Microbacterium arthrosphaerae TaxID=792652 RepID=UPI0035EAD0AC